MNIYIYSDESGVFDKIHNDYFVYGGVVFFNKSHKNNTNRLYINAENIIRKREKIYNHEEIKATKINNSDKSKLYRSLNNCYKFGIVIRQQNILGRIFKSKKDKQRYLDYAYKIGIKRFFEYYIKIGIIIPENVERLFFFLDEHTTATNGIYELKESLEQEFKNGTYNSTYQIFYPPIFNNLKAVDLNFCDSKSKTLIRAADIIANRIYYLSIKNKSPYVIKNNLFVTTLP